MRKSHVPSWLSPRKPGSWRLTMRNTSCVRSSTSTPGPPRRATHRAIRCACWRYTTSNSSDSRSFEFPPTDAIAEPTPRVTSELRVAMAKNVSAAERKIDTERQRPIEAGQRLLVRRAGDLQVLRAQPGDEVDAEPRPPRSPSTDDAKPRIDAQID